VPALGEEAVGLVDVDLAAEEQGELALAVPGAVPLEPPREVLEELVGDAIVSARVLPGSASTSPRRTVRSPSITTRQPTSQM
jgi:hypothetical protein